MTPSELAPYDFRKPRRLADDLQSILSAWHADACGAIADRWALHFGVTTEWAASSLEITRSSDLASEFQEPFLAYSIVLRDDTEPTWFILRRNLAIACVASMFGESLTEIPADRALTDVEQSLTELAMHEVLGALIESQPCTNPMQCQLRGQRHPRELTRTFPDQEQITVAKFSIDAPFGRGEAHWVLSQAAVLRFAAHVGECRLDAQSDRGEMEKIVRKIPLEVVVRLGNADLHVSDLVNLQVGDIVLLNQRVSDPLLAEVAGTTKFLGWPGRIGINQAFQINAHVTPEDN
jgi:flagellar motor switch protein FliM